MRSIGLIYIKYNNLVAAVYEVKFEHPHFTDSEVVRWLAEEYHRAVDELEVHVFAALDLLKSLEVSQRDLEMHMRALAEAAKQTCKS